MTNLSRQVYDVTAADRRKIFFYRYAPWTIPVFTALPFIAFFGVLFTMATNPATAAFYLTSLVLSALLGLIFGVIISFWLVYKGRKFSRILRERIAADGVKASEIEYFTNELSVEDCRTLREMNLTNKLLADAYRETLASKLTALRILNNTRNELLLVGKRENRLKYMKNDATTELLAELKDDRTRLENVKNEAESLRIEAEMRQQKIEAASRRGGVFADNELALQKLIARTEQLPLALEALKMEEDLRKELESLPTEK